jgi:signal transduction histidine kinase
VIESAKSQSNFPLETSIPQASLESILCTEELQRRRSRPPDFEKENRALVALVSTLADSPGIILQTLAETILEITESESAGLSLLTRNDDGKRFYWPAIAGMWNPHVGGGTPRNFGPCGDVLDRNCTLLFTHFERRYPYLIPVMPPAAECLLVPFYVGGKAVGTIWAIMHSDRHKFDAEDERVMGSLGQFASSAYQAVASIDDLKFQVAEREKAETELRKLTDGLETKVLVRTEELEQRNSQLAEARARLAEEKLALERSEAFLAEAQHLSSTGSFCWRPWTGEIRWSEQLYRIFEIEQGVPVTLELVGSRIHPEDISILNDMNERTRAAVSDFEYDYRLLMPDHSVKHVHALAHGSRDADGQLEYIGAVQDVTQRRASEAALATARTDLAHVTRVMSLSTLTASIAHEVSQPLSGMVTNASTCLRMLSSDPPNVEGARETARRTIRDGTRASDVITRLRALFGKEDAAIEVIDLNEAVREVIALSLSELQSNRVILRRQLDSDLPPVAGDRVQLQQVVLNLLRNASDAMNTVDDRPRELLVTTERDEGDRARLSVKDAGVGLDPEAMGQLFEAFYTTKNDGMGIGLSVCRSIIEKHRGLIWATQNDGPGATFSFSIPCGTDTKVQ